MQLTPCPQGCRCYFSSCPPVFSSPPSPDVFAFDFRTSSVFSVPSVVAGVVFLWPPVFPPRPLLIFLLLIFELPLCSSVPSVVAGVAFLRALCGYQVSVVSLTEMAHSSAIMEH